MYNEFPPVFDPKMTSWDDNDGKTEIRMMKGERERRREGYILEASFVLYVILIVFLILITVRIHFQPSTAGKFPAEPSHTSMEFYLLKR